MNSNFLLFKVLGPSFAVNNHFNNLNNLLKDENPKLLINTRVDKTIKNNFFSKANTLESKGVVSPIEKSRISIASAILNNSEEAMDLSSANSSAHSNNNASNGSGINEIKKQVNKRKRPLNEPIISQSHSLDSTSQKKVRVNESRGSFTTQLVNGFARCPTQDGEYLGYFVNGWFEGQGTLISKNSDVYEGEWKSGKLPYGKVSYRSTGETYAGDLLNSYREGVGILTTQKGDIFKGQWNQNFLPFGEVTYFDTGDVYIGNLEIGGVKEGRGILTTQKGDIFKGQWNQNFLPFGEVTYIDTGDVYIGNLGIGGVKEGHGILYENGKKIEGEWKNDQFLSETNRVSENNKAAALQATDKISNHKKAKEKKSSTSSHSNKKLLDGFTGLGQFSFEGYDYTGSFVNGVFEGKGTMTWDNKDKYDGQWKAGVFHGSGIYKQEGNTYSGEFVNGMKEGQGTMLYKNGDKYKGLWRQNKRHGKGIIFWKKAAILTVFGNLTNQKKVLPKGDVKHLIL